MPILHGLRPNLVNCRVPVLIGKIAMTSQSDKRRFLAKVEGLEFAERRFVKGATLAKLTTAYAQTRKSMRRHFRNRAQVETCIGAIAIFCFAALGTALPMI